MEVHHHSHHPKKWKEYVSEFLMLFLAVTLGFFAENIREHYVEKEREEKFIKIVHEDLLNDINALNKIKTAYDLRLKREDTLINILSSPDFSHTNDLYYLARLNSIREFFHHSKNGFQQLKNAGGLRLIEDIDIIKKIQEYENSIDEMEELQQLTENLLMVYREKMSKIFKGVVFKSMPINPSATIIADRFLRPNNNPKLMSIDPIDINEFLVKTLYVHNNNLGIFSRSKKLSEEALELDKILQNHYHLNKQ